MPPLYDPELIATLYECFPNHYWSMKTFSEWQKRFYPDSASELMRYVSAYAQSDTELHVTTRDASMNSWFMVLDPDAGENVGLDAVPATSTAIQRFFDENSIFYLTDKRYHIWIPPWETNLISNWASLYGSKLSISLPYYLSSMGVLPYDPDHLENSVILDTALWSREYGTIRAPYSLHFPTNSIQSMMLDGEVLTPEEFQRIWNGAATSSVDFYTYAKNFHRFIAVAHDAGMKINFLWDKDYAVKEQLAKAHRTGPVSYNWIETLEATAIPKGFRKYALWLLLMPYWVNVKHYDDATTYSHALNWLKLSGAGVYEDADLFIYARNAPRSLKQSGIRPVGFKKLAESYDGLYGLLIQKGIIRSDNTIVGTQQHQDKN
jgi:hypothetical protein